MRSLYTINNLVLSYVEEVKDLGGYVTSNLNFTMHVTYIVSKDFHMLGFINHVTKPISNISVLKTLFSTNVRS